jgi:hypothetical protein
MSFLVMVGLMIYLTLGVVSFTINSFTVSTVCPRLWAHGGWWWLLLPVWPLFIAYVMRKWRNRK